MNITTGLFDHMVLQRSSRNVSDTIVTGQTGAAGKVRVRIRKGSKALRGFDWKTVGSARDGQFEAKLSGIPVGGPYTIELRAGDGKSAGSLTVKDVLVGDVWLVGGQSNMQGCGRAEFAEKPHPMVRAFEMDDRWAVARDPIHKLWACVDQVHCDLMGGRAPTPKKVTHGVGPAVAFGREMHRLSRGVPQGLIASAHGGTTMAQWHPKLCATQSSCLYGAMIRRLKKNGGKTAGLIWYQGESDANVDVVAKYTDAMIEMLGTLRRDAGDAKLPVAIVQLSRVMGWGDRPEWNSIQEQQRRLPEHVKRVVVIPAIDLDLDDTIHIGGKDQHRLGVRLAQAMATMTLAGKAAGKPPISLKDVKVESDPVLGLGRLRLRFDNVVGGLRSSGRPTGFAVRGPDLSHIYRIDIEGNEVVLSMAEQAWQLGRKNVYYGYGTDPFCNVTDAADRSLPVLGPVPITSAEVRTPFVRAVELSDLLPGAGKLHDLVYPDGTLQLRPRRFDTDFCDVHKEMMNAGDRLVYFRCAIECADAMKLAARLGYDGPVKLWVDGRELFHDPAGMNPAFPDKAIAKFDASPGRHEVLVALGSNGGAAWGIFLQFQRLDVDKRAVESAADPHALAPKVV